MSTLNLKDDAQTEIDNAGIANTPTYIVFSIISLLFCCPLGIAATIFSILTIQAKNNSNLLEAEINSRRAYNCMIAAFVLGVISVIGRLIAG